MEARKTLISANQAKALVATARSAARVVLAWDEPTTTTQAWHDRMEELRDKLRELDRETQ